MCDYVYYVFGQEPAVAMHLAFGMLCLSAIRMMFVQIMLAVCMLVGMVVGAKADSVSSVNCVKSDLL